MKTGKWSAIATATLPRVLGLVKYMNIWSIQLWEDWVTRVASKIKGLSHLDWTVLKNPYINCFFLRDLVLVSPIIKLFFLDKNMLFKVSSSLSRKSGLQKLGGV